MDTEGAKIQGLWQRESLTNRQSRGTENKRLQRKPGTVVQQLYSQEMNTGGQFKASLGLMRPCLKK